MAAVTGNGAAYGHQVQQDFSRKDLYNLGMQWLNLVSEDGGIQRLKADNLQPAVTTGIKAVPPYPSTHPVQIGERRDSRGKPVSDRRRAERRRGNERRQKQVPVMLDTRSSRDRRTIEDRRKSLSANKGTPNTFAHIDIYA